MATPAYLRQWWPPWRWWSSVRARLLPRDKSHPFDRAYGVDTDGLIYASVAAEGHAGARHNAGYYATAPSLFRGAMELWQTTLRDTQFAVEDYTLVDIGCGKGRVLMMAAEFPFRKIVGLELDPALARVARHNLSRVGWRRWLGLPHPQVGMPATPQKWTRWAPQPRRPRERVDVRGVEARGPREGAHVRGVEVPRPGSPATGLRRWGGWRPGRLGPRVQIIEGDALSAPLPDGPVALFYFNSFELEMVRMWLAHLGEIAQARTHPLDLIYIHPEFDALVRQVPGMRVLAEAEIPFSQEDAAADIFGVSSDRCVVYRLSVDLVIRAQSSGERYPSAAMVEAPDPGGGVFDARPKREYRILLFSSQAQFSLSS